MELHFRFPLLKATSAFLWVCPTYARSETGSIFFSTSYKRSQPPLPSETHNPRVNQRLKWELHLQFHPLVDNYNCLQTENQKSGQQKNRINRSVAKPNSWQLFYWIIKDLSTTVPPQCKRVNHLARPRVRGSEMSILLLSRCRRFQCHCQCHCCLLLLWWFLLQSSGNLQIFIVQRIHDMLKP